MGTKYIIEIPEDKITDFVGSTHFLMPYIMAGHIGHHDTGLPIEPYTEPDLELIKEKAHTNGYGEGYQDGYSEGMNDYLQNPEVKEESDRAYAHGYSDAESKFSEIRKEAYDKGFEDGKELCPIPEVCHNNAYQKGLSDAWEAAKKIVIGDINIIISMFGTASRSLIIRDLTATKVIERMKAYEQERDAEIKVGDEVKNTQTGVKFIVTHLWENNRGEQGVSGFNQECSAFSTTLSLVVKTGRYFPEISTVLEKMRNEPNAQIDT